MSIVIIGHESYTFKNISIQINADINSNLLDIRVTHLTISQFKLMQVSIAIYWTWIISDNPLENSLIKSASYFLSTTRVNFYTWC